MPGVCPRCKRQVYFAEEKIVLGKPFHTMCVKCGNCGKQVDSGSVTDHQDEIYCKSCYGRLFGPKGYGYGIGAGVLSTDDGSGFNYPVQNGKSTGPPPTESYIAAPAVRADAINNNSAPRTAAPKTAPSSAPKAVINNNYSKGQPKWGGGTYCTRCSKSVFMAERIMAAGGAWHKSCFTCCQCNRSLDSHSMRERERDIYCKPCYGKNFGPKGYWGWSTAKVA